MFMHEITLDGYAAQCAEQPIRLGTAGSYGVETLSVMRKGEWVDYDIIIAFHPPKGETVQIRLGSDNVVSVPAEATAVAGTGELTFAGYTDGVRQISVSQIYRVAASAGTEGIAPAEPTPELVQQILSAANEADSKAEQAQKVAQSVRDDADAGKFNGPQGPKGDTGPQGPVGPQGPKGDTGPAVALDTSLTHEGEAADAKATGDAISAVKARQNILVGSETGNPVAVDDAFAAPLCNLTVYGKSTQDGTPTPDAPVPIVSAGDGGTIAVTLSDGNGKTQTLTLPTPAGLPGIPVLSGGNYTDPQGQRWVCDEVDLERGVVIKRNDSFAISAENARDIAIMNDFTKVTVATSARIRTPEQTNRNDILGRVLFCEALPWERDVWGSKKNAMGFSENHYIDFSIENSYLGLNEASTDNERKTALIKYFTAEPCQVLYRIATPIETPLTPAEIAEYKALTAYAPDTVMQASDGAGIRLDYQRDVNLVVKNLEDAIASMITT